MPSFSSIAIVGSGAIGTYYGARFARAGSDVRFLMRSDLAAVRERGSILVHEKGGDWSLSPVSAFASTEAIGPVDLVIVTVKTTANDALKALLPPLLHASTTVLTLQNGLGNEEFLESFLGAERIVGGMAFIGVNRIGPGELKGFQSPGYVILGEYRGAPGARCRALAERFIHSGIECRVAEALLQARWLKLVWNVPFNGLSTVLGGLPTDQILRDPSLVKRIRGIMEEVVAIAAARGHVIDRSVIEHHVTHTPELGAYLPSTALDYLAGREVEIEPIWGEPLRQAREAGVAAPLLTELHRQIRERCRT